VIDRIAPPPGYRVIPPRLNLAEEVLDRPIDRGRADAVAIRAEQETITYETLRARVIAGARGLLELGLRPGMTYLIRLQNSIEFCVAFLAGVRIGAIPILTNTLLGSRELEHIVAAVEPRLAITQAEMAEPVRALQKDAATFERVVVVGDARLGEVAFERLAISGGTLSPADTRADDAAFMICTSGTTGPVKAVTHAHRWVIAVGDLSRLRVGADPGDIILATGEMSFLGALGHGFLFPLRAGASGVMLPGRPHPDRVLEAVERFRVTAVYAVPSLFRRILAEPGIERRYDLSSLRHVDAGGEALGHSSYHEWRQRFACELYEYFALSEFQMIVANGPGLTVKPGSVGLPFPGVRVAVLDERMEPVAPGQIGQFSISCDDPGLCLGYRNQSERWRNAIRHGWFQSGDLFTVDEDGYYWFAGRSDDVFKSRGYQISPVEIEAVLNEHAAVAESLVVGDPEPEIGHHIRAMVVLRPGHRPSAALAEDIRAAVRSQVAPYKVPKMIEFADQLPKNPVGKLVRQQVRTAPVPSSP
jgi:acyl-coenzyme A synthetase/AMP-(fatty) acid ligase